jgi:hypothetical protein
MNLEIELIPINSWYYNLRNAMTKKEWDLLRDSIAKKVLNNCAICKKNSKKIEVHEKWKFNNKKNTQTLISLEPICHLCHSCIHIGNSKS